MLVRGQSVEDTLINKQIKHKFEKIYSTGTKLGIGRYSPVLGAGFPLKCPDKTDVGYATRLANTLRF